MALPFSSLESLPLFVRLLGDLDATCSTRQEERELVLPPFMVSLENRFLTLARS